MKRYSVERTQVLKAWSAFLKGQSTEDIFEDRDAISGPLDEWDDYFRIDVGGYNRDVELKRTLKKQAVDDLVNVFDQWQASTQTFEQDVALEVRDAGKNYMNTYLTMVSPCLVCWCIQTEAVNTPARRTQPCWHGTD